MKITIFQKRVLLRFDGKDRSREQEATGSDMCGRQKWRSYECIEWKCEGRDKWRPEVKFTWPQLTEPGILRVKGKSWLSLGKSSTMHRGH